jgi:hypothetical protein
VCEVLFDCFGEFDGFTLCDCHRAHRFRTHHRGFREIAIRACKERFTLSGGGGIYRTESRVGGAVLAYVTMMIRAVIAKTNAQQRLSVYASAWAAV